MIDGFKGYAQYKPSGSNWLDGVPAHWETRRAKHLFREVDARSERGDERLLSLRMQHGLVDHLDAGGKSIEASALVGFKRVVAGQIVMNRMRAASGLFAVAPRPGIVSPDYAVFQPLPLADPRYYVPLFKTPVMRAVFKAESKGLGTGEAGFMRLYSDRFGDIRVPHPPLDEQLAIARFLDHADASIRRYIRAKQKLISLLMEQKQAITSRAVTRGLDPDARRRSSEIEWTDGVPEHWQVLPLKRVLRRLIDCEHKTAPAVEESEYRVVRTTAVRHGTLRLDGTYCTSEDAFRAWTRRGSPEPGDVIFTREAPAGEACVVPADRQLCLGQRTVLFKVDRKCCDPSYLVHQIYAGPPRHRIRIASQGSTVGHFNVEDIAAMPVLVPSLEEQMSIVKFLEDETRALDVTLRRAESEIGLLREYHTRLITDVVTGKLDVRAAAESLTEETGEAGQTTDDGLSDEPDSREEELFDATLEAAET